MLQQRRKIKAKTQSHKQFRTASTIQTTQSNISPFVQAIVCRKSFKEDFTPFRKNTECTLSTNDYDAYASSVESGCSALQESQQSIINSPYLVQHTICSPIQSHSKFLLEQSIAKRSEKVAVSIKFKMQDSKLFRKRSSK